jgi:hypothetical protein
LDDVGRPTGERGRAWLQAESTEWQIAAGFASAFRPTAGGGLIRTGSIFR